MVPVRFLYVKLVLTKTREGSYCADVFKCESNCMSRVVCPEILPYTRDQCNCTLSLYFSLRPASVGFKDLSPPVAMS